MCCDHECDRYKNIYRKGESSDVIVGSFPESKSSGGINGGKLGVRTFGKFENKIIGSNAGGLGDSGSAARFFKMVREK